MNDLQKFDSILQDEKAHEITFWQHEKQLHYTPYLRNAFLLNIRQSEHPNGKHTWWRCKEQSEDSASRVSPCGHSRS